MSASEYLPSIGIETHVQLKTKTKLFAAVGNDARGAEPNTLISHICVGMPGALPVLNKAAVDLACRAAFALNSQPQKFSKFDRKHYFYPDLPKGYQISQYEQPLVLGGHVDIYVDGDISRVGIVRVHLEEDAGKNTHPPGTDYSLIDLNRAGTPLLEIVSQPDIHSPAQAKAYARELYLLMKYAKVSDCDMYHGNLRFDVNVSVSKNPSKLGNRSEIKNLNSFRSVEGAVAYEIKRQIEALQKGQEIIQETRGWDEAKQKTIAQRGKEEAHDYRYMPEPDVPPIELTEEYIKRVKSQLPKLPSEVRSELQKLALDHRVIEDLLDRPAALKHTLEVLSAGDQTDAHRVAFWFIHGQPAMEQEPQFKEPNIDTSRLLELSAMVRDGQLNSNAASKIFNQLIKSKDSPIQIAQRLNLLQLSEGPEIDKIVDAVIAQNPKTVEDIKNGKHTAVGYLVGQAMKRSKGQANPELVSAAIRKKLGIK